MRQQQSLENYPGYFPPEEGIFWTRLKVGIAAALAGLVVGVGGHALVSDAGSTDAAGASSVVVTHG